MKLALLPFTEARPFGDHLVSAGMITRGQLRIALSLQKRRPFLHVGELLCQLGLIDEKALESALEAFHSPKNGLPAPTPLVTPERPPAAALEAIAVVPQAPVVGVDLFNKIHTCKQAKFFREAQERGTYPYFQALQMAESSTTRINNRSVVLLAANSYLGMSDDPEVIEASIEATRRYGVGTSGSPMLNGTMDLHVALEQELSTFMGKPGCALYSTGYQTNVGVISSLVGRGDVVFADALAHASIHDACQLGMGDFKRFRHNDLDHLETMLQTAGNRGKLIAIDGVYSMDGDLAPLPAIVKLARTYGARILLDDAHGFGVIGAHGRGTAEYFGLLDEMDVITVTFSKALGTIGGCVLGDLSLIRYLKHRSRAFIFSASLPPGTVAATRASLARLESDPEPRARLQANVAYMRKGLVELGFNLGDSRTHILPVQIGEDALALAMGTELLAEGVLTGTVVSPGVPPGKARLRVSLMASHQTHELDTALAAFERVGTKLGVIQRPRVAGS
jgi:8-amino-7-oxononanoate synthase